MTDKTPGLKENKLVKAVPLAILETEFKLRFVRLQSPCFPRYAPHHASFLFKFLDLESGTNLIPYAFPPSAWQPTPQLQLDLVYPSNRGGDNQVVGSLASPPSQQAELLCGPRIHWFILQIMNEKQCAPHGRRGSGIRQT